MNKARLTCRAAGSLPVSPGAVVIASVMTSVAKGAWVTAGGGVKVICATVIVAIGDGAICKRSTVGTSGTGVLVGMTKGGVSVGKATGVSVGSAKGVSVG